MSNFYSDRSGGRDQSRQGQQNNKRMRGRNRKGPNPLTRSYESNGPDVKIRGTALHIAEKYIQLARDAQGSGDRVAGENYLQHAEHYYRIVAAAQAQMPQAQPFVRSEEESDEEEDRGTNGFGGQQPFRQGGQSGYSGGNAQPYANGGNSDGDDEPPMMPTGGAQPDEPRFEPRANNPQPQEGAQGGGGSYRSRRRRPYRERFNDQNAQGGQDGGGNAPQPAPDAGSDMGSEAPPGDD